VCESECGGVSDKHNYRAGGNMKEVIKEIPLTQAEFFYTVADVVMENMPFSNTAFNPKDKDECVDMLKALIENSKIAMEWLQGVVNASYSNQHIYIDYDKDEKWFLLNGMSKAKNTREEFVNRCQEIHKKMVEGKVTVNGKKSKYGKNYFKKK
jgi:hypothetical protein